MSIPKDGYYIADVQLDSGGLCPMYVHVNLGKPHDEWGGELLPEACSNFREVDTTLMVRVWPQNAAMELEALRTANAGLVERVKRLDDELADYMKLFCDWTAYATNLESAGKQMLDGGFHAPHIISGWREAEGTRP